MVIFKGKFYFISKALKFLRSAISKRFINFVGFIDIANRDRTLKLLNLLLREITNHWPNIEFLTSVQLGKLITKESIL